MLRIFEQEESERPPDRKLLLERLQEADAPPAAKATEPPSAAVVAERSVPPSVPPSLKVFERKPALSPPAMTARPAPPAFELLGAPIPPELQALAEQFTRGFWGALVATIRDIQAPAAEDHRKLQNALDLHAKTVLAMEALRSDVDAAFERTDSLAKSLQDAQQTMENRLEVQAEVIRSLHAGLQAREEELDKVLTAFQSLRGASGERSPRRSLPEKL